MSLLNLKTNLKLCILHMLNFCKLIFCIWIRRLQSGRPVNGFKVSFSILKHNREQKTI